MLSIAIHGGAGSLPRHDMTPEKQARYARALATALDAGYAELERGGSSLDAVAAAVRSLEDEPLFNAGRGAVLTRLGTVELDAAIMDGATTRAGAVAGIRHVRNPVDLARLVMEHSPYVMLIGSGAEDFALEQGVALVPNEYFRTEARTRQLQRLLAAQRALAESAAAAAATLTPPGTPVNDLSGDEPDDGSAEDSLGTVGAVACDGRGHLAAATSTGGLMGKRPGRVGDSPIIGAGTWADDACGAISATGHGEFFIRNAVAHDICARVAYLRQPLARAVHDVVHEKLAAIGAEGGVIAVAPDGEIVMDFNSEGMFRAVRTSKGRREIAIYRDS